MLSRYSSRSFESVRAVKSRWECFRKKGSKLLKFKSERFSGNRVPQTPFHDIDLEMEKVEIQKFSLGSVCESEQP